MVSNQQLIIHQYSPLINGEYWSVINCCSPTITSSGSKAAINIKQTRIYTNNCIQYIYYTLTTVYSTYIFKRKPDRHKTMKLSSTNFVLLLEKQPIRTLYTINTKNILKSVMTERLGMNLFNNYIIIIYCLNVFN
jgi:hypothetical protein